MQNVAAKISSQVIRLPEPDRAIVPRKLKVWLNEYRNWCQGHKPRPLTWETANETVRNRAENKLVLCMRIQELAEEQGIAPTAATQCLIERLANSTEDARIVRAAETKKGFVGVSTLLRWYKAWKDADFDRDVLIDQHCGRPPTWWGWEELVVDLWLRKGCPSHGDIVFWLKSHYQIKTTKSRVRHFLDKLPAEFGRLSRYRIGEHNWQQNHSVYKERNTRNLPVGFEWEADGHTIDVYVAHPKTGNPTRFELTIFIDVRSQKVVAWNVWYSESALNTVFTLANGIEGMNHVPKQLHVDPGPGFKNKQVEHYLKKNDIRVVFARPGNARGKGLVEGWFKHFEARCGRLFSTYCGHGRVDDDLNRLRMRIKRGEIVLPSLEEVIAVIGNYIAHYNDTPKSGNLNGASPNQVWAAEFVQDPPAVPEDAALRFSAVRTVRNYMVRMTPDPGKPARKWTHERLGEFNNDQVLVEWDPRSFDTVWIKTLKGGAICQAHEIDRPDAVSESELQAAERRRTLHRIKRLEAHRQEVEDQQLFERDPAETAGQILPMPNQQDTLIEQHHNPLNELDAQAHQVNADSLDDIDFLDTDY